MIDFASIRRVITHDNCHDGLAAALIIKDALPNVKIEFVQYDTRAHRELRPEFGDLFCDFTPYVERDKLTKELTIESRERLNSWAYVGTYVLDHHPGAEDVVSCFGERGIFGLNERGESGALLAYKHIWLPRYEAGVQSPMRLGMGTTVAALAVRAGVRDCWHTHSPLWQEACEQAAELMCWSREALLQNVGSAGPRGLYFKTWCANDQTGPSLGRCLLDEQRKSDEKTLAQAFRCHVAVGEPPMSLALCMFEGKSREASDIAEMLGGEVDLVAAWNYFVQRAASLEPDRLSEHASFDSFQVRKMKISIRSCNPAIDCSIIAKHHGGNGHHGAAGFVVDVQGLPADPYQAVIKLIKAGVEWMGA